MELCSESARCWLGSCFASDACVKCVLGEMCGDRGLFMPCISTYIECMLHAGWFLWSPGMIILCTCILDLCHVGPSRCKHGHADACRQARSVYPSRAQEWHKLQLECYKAMCSETGRGLWKVMKLLHISSKKSPLVEESGEYLFLESVSVVNLDAGYYIGSLAYMTWFLSNFPMHPSSPTAGQCPCGFPFASWFSPPILFWRCCTHFSMWNDPFLGPWEHYIRSFAALLSFCGVEEVGNLAAFENLLLDLGHLGDTP